MSKEKSFSGLPPADLAPERAGSAVAPFAARGAALGALLAGCGPDSKPVVCWGLLMVPCITLAAGKAYTVPELAPVHQGRQQAQREG